MRVVWSLGASASSGCWLLSASSMLFSIADKLAWAFRSGQEAPPCLVTAVSVAIPKQLDLGGEGGKMFLCRARGCGGGGACEIFRKRGMGVDGAEWGEGPDEMVEGLECCLLTWRIGETLLPRAVKPAASGRSRASALRGAGPALATPPHSGGVSLLRPWGLGRRGGRRRGS